MFPIMTVMTGLLIQGPGAFAQTESKPATPSKPAPQSSTPAPDQSIFWQRSDQIEPVSHHRTIVRGQIVMVRPDDIMISIGAASGIRIGDLIRIKRTFSYTHPDSKVAHTVWLPIGTTTIVHVGGDMSKADHEVAKLIFTVREGDLVECVVKSDAPAETTVAKEELPDPATSAWLNAWQANVGKTLKARIGVWEEYLRSQPDSRHAALAANYLRELRTVEARVAPPVASPNQATIDGIEHDPPRSSDPFQPIDLAFHVAKPEALAGAWLHYRRSGARSYRTAPLEREGELYLRGRIPADVVDVQGIDYYVEAATHDGNVGAAVGTPDDPIAVVVKAPPISRLFTTPKHRSRVSLTASYLDFNNLRDGSDDRSEDRVMLFEADFLYRFRSSVHSIRTGFGAFSGAHDGAAKPSFKYGYTELEFRNSDNVALSSRLIVGVGNKTGIGGEGRLRLGSEEDSHLSIGFSKIQGIGYVADVRMQWNAMVRAPLGLSVAVTDQPNEGDNAVRLTMDLGYRFRPWIQPTLRLSYQARNVNHAGVGAGLGLVLDW